MLPSISRAAVIGMDIAQASALLERDQLVAIPTETVYGLAGNALRTEAVARIFEVKNRPTFDPLIVHTDCLEKAVYLVREMPERAQRLAETFWPGPLTLLLLKQDLIPDLVTAGLDMVAVRIPNHPLTRSLLARLDFPLAAPSANPFGYVSPTTAQHVQNQLGTRVPYILDGGPCQVGIESTIVGFESGRAMVYRLGGISVEDVEKVIGPVGVMTQSTSNPRTPGSLQSHYAPRKPVFIREWESLFNQYSPEEIGLLRFTEPLPVVPTRNQIVLSAKGDLSEAAQHLFAGLRSLDTAPVKVIFAELVPERGLGRAINDRLRRAAAK